VALADVHRALDRFNGREVKSTGDGFLATFDGPALVAGSGIQFSDRGTHTLKGISDTWQLYAVTGP
jgi:class 3 adenylate cyclase